MTTHILKTKDPFFHLVKTHRKNFEVRQYIEQSCGACQACRREPDDIPCYSPVSARDFKEGDTLHLVLKTDFNCFVNRRIKYILWDKDYPEGIKPGFCILGLEDL